MTKLSLDNDAHTESYKNLLKETILHFIGELNKITAEKIDNKYHLTFEATFLTGLCQQFIYHAAKSMDVPLLNAFGKFMQQVEDAIFIERKNDNDNEETNKSNAD